MENSNKFDEFDFLNLFYQEMLSKGKTYNFIRLSINSNMVDDVCDEFSVSVTEERLNKLADICLANNWIEHKFLGSGQYGNLQLTMTGFGVVKSKQKQREVLNSRNFIKKISDIIVDHKGLFVLFGFFIALVGLFLNMFWKQ